MSPYLQAAAARLEAAGFKQDLIALARSAYLAGLAEGTARLEQLKEKGYVRLSGDDLIVVEGDHYVLYEEEMGYGRCQTLSLEQAINKLQGA